MGDASDCIALACIAAYAVLAVVVLMRLLLVHGLFPASRKRVFHVVLLLFAGVRCGALYYFTQDREGSPFRLLDRGSSCLYFSLLLFIVLHWVDIVNPVLSVRSRRIWTAFAVANVVFYAGIMGTTVVVVMGNGYPSQWLNTFPDILIATASVAISAGCFHAARRMRHRVRRLVDEDGNKLGAKSQRKLLRAVRLLNAVMVACTLLFLVRAVVYMAHPFYDCAAQDGGGGCGPWDNTVVFLVLQVIVPEFVPTVLLMCLMWEPDAQARRGPIQAGAASEDPLLGAPGGVDDSELLCDTLGRLSTTSSRISAAMLALPGEDESDHDEDVHPFDEDEDIDSDDDSPSTERQRERSVESQHLLHERALLAADSAAAVGDELLCLSLRIDALALGEAQGSMVVLSTRDGADGELVEIGRTEVVAGTRAPAYSVLFHVRKPAVASPLPSPRSRPRPTLKRRATTTAYGVRHETQLHFAVYGMGAQTKVDAVTAALGAQPRLGETEMEVTDLLLAPEATRPLLGSSAHSQRLTVAVEGSKRVSRRARQLDETVRHYRFGPLLVEETLAESGVTFDVAGQFLRVLAARTSAQLREAREAAPPPRPSADLGQTDDDDDDDDEESGLMSGLVQHVREAADGRSGKEWLAGRVQQLSEHLFRVEAAVARCGREAAAGSNFKPSTAKAEPELAFVATNLHVQNMRVRRQERGLGAEAPLGEAGADYSTVTVGAFAAHAYGFKRGGVRQLREELQSWSRQTHAELSRQASCLTANATRRAAAEVRWEVERRTEVAVAQALAALATSVIQELHVRVGEGPAEAAVFLQQLASAGFLFAVESLISTHGKEAGMLGDMDAAVRELGGVRLRLARDGEAVRVRAERGALVLEIPVVVAAAAGAAQDGERRPATAAVPVQLPPAAADALPEGLLAVTPVLFTQGINEMQTVANTVGRSSLQADINRESLERLREYVLGVAHFMRERGARWEHRAAVEADMLQLHRECHRGRPEKNVRILTLACHIVRALRGGRVTVCKSAKDRTAMSVTLEQARLLVREHGLPAEAEERVARVMRAHGVRRANVHKNIGKGRYCFNVLQRFLLPSEYQCPPGTGGGAIS